MLDRCVLKIRRGGAHRAVLPVLQAVLVSAPAIGAPQEGAEKVDLRPLARSNERYEVSEQSTWSDELVRMRLRSGDEIILDIDAASAGTSLAMGRQLKVERAFEDGVEAVQERDGAASATRLVRTWKKLEATLRVDEEGAERGRRIRRMTAPVVDRRVTLSRNEEGFVSANLLPKQPVQGQQEAPVDPPAADLALCAMDARFEQCLPAEPVALEGSWPLSLDAARALIGSLDGYPFPRAEAYPGGIASELRQADPLAVFLQRGALTATAKLIAKDEGSATIAVDLVVDLDQVELYRVAPSSTEGSDVEAAAENATPASQSLPWKGQLRASGRLIFDRTRRQVQSATLTGSYETSIEAEGAEGAARTHVEISTQGTFERSARIFSVSS